MQTRLIRVSVVVLWICALTKRAHTNWYAYDLDRTDHMENDDWEIWRAKRTVVNSMQAIQLGGRGDMTNSAVRWEHHKSLPNVPSPLLYGEILYLVKDGGIVASRAWSRCCGTARNGQCSQPTSSMVSVTQLR